MIEVICDTLLPGDPALGMPPASRLDMDGYFRAHGLESAVQTFVALLDDVAMETFERDFASLSTEQRLQCLEKSKRRDLRLANEIIIHALKAYYSDAIVLRELSDAAVPPFPEGNTLEEDDWTILEPVLERGPIFRVVEP